MAGERANDCEALHRGSPPTSVGGVEAMETWTDAVSRASRTGCESGPGGENRRQSSRPVADRGLARFAHCFV